jgi:hypothetical protein
LRQPPSASSAAAPGTCKVGRAPGRRLSSQAAVVGPEDRGFGPGSAPQSRTLLTVLTVFSRAVRTLITLFPARPSRLKGNVDAERPKEDLRPTQVAGEGARIFGPAGAVPRNMLTAAFSANPQKIGAAAARSAEPASASKPTVAANVVRRKTAKAAQKR